MSIVEALADSSATGGIVAALLREQQQTTAVEKFARAHDDEANPLAARFYRDLIPLERPGPDEQYAFEVDLDACSGCKACVAACHSMNGLAENETWREVGLLQGGTSESPILQHVTTACHHCLEPACLHGCPVKAYDKDPLTGIVRHLDDQCIGCQYCVFKCPYDVPKYLPSLGIVRKCDMCRQRLAVDEAPACVQACPNRAIRIVAVNKQSIADDCESNMFLPGAPEPGYTLPTTVYRTERPASRSLLPSDYYTARPQHGHWPLVAMLVFTQMSVGAFAVEQLLGSPLAAESASASQQARGVHLVAALLLGLIGMGASIFHLGRPLFAYRALLGLRTSWLSREILVFSLFAAAAALYTTAAWLTASDGAFNWLGALAALCGAGGVFCSVMVYVDTHRPLWSPLRTTFKFALTSLILGLATALVIALAGAAWSEEITAGDVMRGRGSLLCRWLVAAVALKLLLESEIFTHLRSRRNTPLKRSAMLLTGDLGIATAKRYFFGVAGGVLLPLLLLSESFPGAGGAFSGLFLGIVAVLSLAVLLLGELTERWLFFTSVVAPKMPGAPAA